MTIRVYIDTNVYLNAIENRDDHLSRDVIRFLEARGIALYINDLSIINIHYITRKSTARTESKAVLKKILSLHGLVSIDKTIIELVLESTFGDFEDAVQYYCAKKIGADLILTSNAKDFIHSDIKVLTPAAFFERYVH